MRLALPSMPETLSYAVAASIAITLIEALVMLVIGPYTLVGFVLVVALAVAIYWLIGHNRATLVTARDAAAATGLLLLVCAFADLLAGYPYQAVLFLLAAAALGFTFMLLQQGMVPRELRFGPVVAMASAERFAHLRMLEELRAAGILTPDEFAAKRALVEV
jgi:hypothetical protein